MPAADPNAHSKVQRALRSGKLVRPDRCDRCGAAEVKLSDGRSGLHAHHEDYSKPLDVQWLCVTCHLGVRQSDSRRIHVVMDPEMLRRIDAAVPTGTTRGEFVRAAVEQALGPGSGEASGPAAVKGANVAPVSPAPAEQPQMSDTERKGFENLTGVRSSVQAKRDVRPVPKAKP